MPSTGLVSSSPAQGRRRPRRALPTGPPAQALGGGEREPQPLVAQPAGGWVGGPCACPRRRGQNTLRASGGSHKPCDRYLDEDGAQKAFLPRSRFWEGYGGRSSRFQPQKPQDSHIEVQHNTEDHRLFLYLSLATPGARSLTPICKTASDSSFTPSELRFRFSMLGQSYHLNEKLEVC